MERSISMESWEEVQRHGQGLAEKLNSLAQGIGGLVQSHIRTSPAARVPETAPLESPPTIQQDGWGLRISMPWPFEQSRLQQTRLERTGYDVNKRAVVVERKNGVEISSTFYDLGHKLGQAGADLGACVGGLVGNVVSQFQKTPMGITTSVNSSAEVGKKRVGGALDGLAGGTLEWKEKDKEEGGTSSAGIVLNACQAPPVSRKRRAEEGSVAAPVPAETQASSSTSSSSTYEATSDELVAAIAKSSNQFHKQSSINVTTTYDSRTQDIESSVVARGDLWRAEASHGGPSSNGSSPLFLLQIGPILFVRDTTLLLPIHLSKRHLLWYGFDRKNGLHSLCPAIWSKHRRWLLMSMICLNPFTCSFMDLQFPNGQMTYVAGEGLSGSAFVPVCGGLLQVQGRHPGESKLSFSFKNRCGTRVCPSLNLPEKSVSVGVTQPLAWQRSGLMLRPTIQLSVTPTFGGRNAGWRAEVVHSPKEKLSVACGCSLTLEPSAFASISVGRSKRNGEHTGSSGLVLQVETPLENLRRASFSVQLNSGVEF